MVDGQRVRALFLAALEHEPIARAAFVRAEAGAEPALRQRVQQLLDAHEQTGGWLGDPVKLPAVDGLVGQVIGERYRLLEVIGSGGMGTVYLAEQTQPVQRRVALKLIKQGLDSAPLLARFDAERQALAMMDHPHIAKVFDAGLTPLGLPYFVMEWVQGVALTAYCAQQQCSVAERLRLFVAVCQAVQHAHQKGIIHRDLKPANILVEQRDGQGQPTIIDFGLAKIVAPYGQPAVSSAGVWLGTPLYMAPEQTDPAKYDIDTRADIYALGVILYELLTGQTPLAHEALAHLTWTEMARVIQTTTPPVPSVRLRGATETNTPWQTVRGDLDWIVMKALAKEREQRYATANALALDVQRYLLHEPVAAGPPTWRYRMRKLVRRHRIAALVSVTMLVVLVAGVIGTSWGLWRALRAEEAAQKQAMQEAAARQQVDAVAEALEKTFLSLDPFDDQQDLLRQLSGKIDALADDMQANPNIPALAKARLQNALGLANLGLGYPPKAVGLFRLAWDQRRTELGEDHPLTLEALANYGEAQRQANNFTAALPLLEEAVVKWEAVAGPKDRRTLAAQNDLALVLQDTNQLDRAEPLARRVCEVRSATLGPMHPDTLLSMNNLAGVLRRNNKLAEALPLYEEVLGRRTARLGKTHAATIASMNNLAFAYQKNNEVHRALPLYEQMVELQRERLGADHPDTLLGLNNLAGAYLVAKQPERAMPLFAKVAEARTRRLGEDHEDTLITLYNWGTAAIAAKDYAAAEAPLRIVVRVRQQRDPNQWRLFNTQSLLGSALLAQGKYAEAEPLLVQGGEGLLRQRAMLPGGGSGPIVRALERLVELYRAWNKPPEMERWQKQLELLRRS